MLSIVLMVAGAGPAAAQITKLPRPDTARTSGYGSDVAISGDLAVVGASAEDTCGPNGGAAYVYVRASNGVDWTQVARLTPTPCRPNAFFGASVAASDARVLVGATSEYFAEEKENAAYVFARQADGTWQQTARLTPDARRPEGRFAVDVALDGDRAAVSTAGSSDAAYHGAVYVFDYTPATDAWQRTARLTAAHPPEDGVLGGAVALDGNRIAVAASTYFRDDPGGVYVFDKTRAGAWSSAAFLPGIDAFTISVALAGRRLVVGESRAGDDASGRVQVYTERRPGAWHRTATLHPMPPYANGQFGALVAADGPWLLATGYDEQLDKEFNIDRVVYVYKRTARGWSQRLILDIGQVDFGAALAVDRGTAIVSHVPETGAGVVYVAQLP
ncbi:Kelch repeat-containing protein [Salisaeta longa]|uniref:FG-GAP repeat protein n=1 Tax=Salisaeta longa TaxID=503170 RepID=UPI000405519B|nr:FG-GAP repeat protein [Salisaeta longa]